MPTDDEGDGQAEVNDSEPGDSESDLRQLDESSTFTEVPN